MQSCTICRTEGEYMHPITDARGIYVGRVCSDECATKLESKYRPEVMNDPNYYADEPIEPEPEIGGYQEW